MCSTEDSSLRGMLLVIKYTSFLSSVCLHFRLQLSCLRLRAQVVVSSSSGSNSRLYLQAPGFNFKPKYSCLHRRQLDPEYERPTILRRIKLITKQQSVTSLVTLIFSNAVVKTSNLVNTDVSCKAAACWCRIRISPQIPSL